MKIAVFHELTPLSGARKAVEEYGKILSKRNTVDLFYIDEIKDKRVNKFFTNVFFFKFKGKYWKGDDWKAKLYKDTFELIKLYFLHRKISSIINKGNYDFVFVNPSKFTQTPFILRFLKIPKVYYCQEALRIVYERLFEVPKNLNMVKKIYEKINRRVRKLIDLSNIKKADIIFANSFFSKNNIENVYRIKAYVCYLGVDPKKFFPKNLKKDYDLIFVGEKSEIEGYDLLEKTLKLFKNKPLVKYIFRNQRGQGISEQSLVEELNKTKIALALSRSEPFGLVPLEAMACGVPVVAVAEGGFKESVVDGKTGFLIKRDPKALYTVVNKLLQDENLRIKLGQQAREYVISKWTWQKSVERFVKILKENNLDIII